MASLISFATIRSRSSSSSSRTHPREPGINSGDAKCCFRPCNALESRASTQEMRSAAFVHAMPAWPTPDLPAHWSGDRAVVLDVLALAEGTVILGVHCRPWQRLRHIAAHRLVQGSQ